MNRTPGQKLIWVIIGVFALTVCIAVLIKNLNEGLFNNQRNASAIPMTILTAFALYLQFKDYRKAVKAKKERRNENWEREDKDHMDDEKNS